MELMLVLNQTIEVYSTTGQLIKQVEIKSIHTIIELSKEVRGVYFLKVNQQQVTKLIKL